MRKRPMVMGVCSSCDAVGALFVAAAPPRLHRVIHSSAPLVPRVSGCPAVRRDWQAPAVEQPLVPEVARWLLEAGPESVEAIEQEAGAKLHIDRQSNKASIEGTGVCRGGAAPVAALGHGGGGAGVQGVPLGTPKVADVAVGWWRPSRCFADLLAI